MHLFENIQLALNGLRTSKMRALLTMLGIIIGIGSVIAIVTVGNSLTVMFTEQMSSFGVNNIQVGMSYVGASEYVTLDSSDFIKDEMIAALEEYFGDRLAAVSITEMFGQGQARDGRKYANTDISGVSPGYKIINDVEMINGRFIADRDHQKNRNVAVISDFMAEKIFGNADPLGKEVKINTGENSYAFTVIGVYKYEQNAMMGGMGGGAEEDRSTDTYIPVSTAVRLGGNRNSGYTWFMAAAATGESGDVIAAEIAAFFNNNYYSKNENWRIDCYSMESMMSQVTSILTGISFAIAFIAAISLLVGGIGVMNIMLVSVTERTREIGTRKALGARNSAIRIQFIVESIIICTIGGVIGIAAGVGLGILGSSVLESFMLGTTGTMKAVVPMGAVVLAVGFSMLIGVFFGYYPANKAAKLDPIEALRYE